MVRRSVTLALTLALLLVFAGCSGDRAATVADPLPSWNDTAPKKAIVAFVERVSKPGRRVYASVKNLPRVNNGLGISVLSTPKGIMADHDAREANVGGEILFTVF